MSEIVQPRRFCGVLSVHFTIYMDLCLYSYRRETARQLRMYAQLTRCFSAVAELLVVFDCERSTRMYYSVTRTQTRTRVGLERYWYWVIGQYSQILDSIVIG